MSEQSEQTLRKLTDDLTLLIEASSVLAGSLKLENVLPRTLDLCRSLITADGYAVWLFDANKWSIVSSSGLSEEYQRLAFEMLDHSVPMLDKPMILEDPDNSMLLKTHRDAQRREGIESLLVIPLRISGMNAGTVVFYYKKKHRFSDAEVRIGTGIGNLVGATMTSVRAVENEAALRRQAEKARQRATFLAQLSTVLSQTLDLQTTLEKVVRLAISVIPETCTIYFRDEAGNFLPVAMTHVDPEKEQLQRAFAKAYQPAANPSSTVKRVFETQEPVLIRKTEPHHLELPNVDASTTDTLRGLNPRSVMMAPLIARGKSIGVIAFSTSDPARLYNEDDLGFAQEIALHAAWMADNARLYSEVLTADKRKDQFLAMLGHELRNPLAPVLTGVEILSSNQVTLPQREETLCIIRRQIGHMSRIVDDLLDVSRIRSGRMEFKKESVDLSSIVEACARDHSQLFEKMKIRFTYDAGRQQLWADADAVRISQAIGNLLNNASKFTPAGGEVRLTLTRQSESQAVIAVKDSGVGVPAEMLPRLFEIFSQGEMSIDRTRGGLGLGLVLVKGLVEAHGGSVAARCHDSAGGSGSEFIMTLPLIVAKPNAVAPPAPARNGRAWRILIIEDHADVAQTMKVLLTLAGHTVAVSPNGLDGIQKVDEFKPQVVLCDIGLPGGMDGLAVARALRRSGSRIKLAALSGYGTISDQQQSLTAGFDYHLTKPVELRMLEKMLNEDVTASSSAVKLNSVKLD